jgi:hypothetical protein
VHRQERAQRARESREDVPLPIVLAKRMPFLLRRQRMRSQPYFFELNDLVTLQRAAR